MRNGCEKKDGRWKENWRGESDGVWIKNKGCGGKIERRIKSSVNGKRKRKYKKDSCGEIKSRNGVRRYGGRREIKCKKRYEITIKHHEYLTNQTQKGVKS
jgi:hypothetical protein